MPQTPATARTAADVDPEARQEAPPMGPLLNRTGARVPLCFFVGFLFLDATSAVILGASTVGFDFHPFHWGSIDSFEDRTVDVVVLIAVRLVLCAAVAVPLRMYLLRCQWTLEETLRCEAAGDQGEDDDHEEDDADCQGERTSFLSTRDKKGTTSKNRHGKRRSATTTPSGAPSPAGQRLRGASADQEEDYLAIPTDALCVETTNGAGPFDAARRRSTLRSTQSMQRIVVLLILFVFFTAFNIFVAIKCLYFHYTLSPWQQLAMALSVVWTNAEMLCLKLYLERATGSRDGDALHPKLHPHPLRFNHHVTCTKCDVCSQRIEREGFECAGTCSFDCCLVCFRKRTAAHGENLLSRTDKGSGIQGGKHDGSVSPWQYIFRGMKIILPFWRLVLLAMACLVANQTVRVALPKFQGEVLDSVVTARQDDFWRNIRWYLALSVTLLLVGSIRTFCIQLVMRNVVFSLRERVYESLIYRDVAFFDGATVGALTSRMTTDVNAMVSPLSALFNTVIANVILLVGGMGMCLQVSWKLSMISFSVVGPILFISSAYAKWSSKLNRSIWDSLAQANSQATEAFSNIRTVKSFSTEGLELARYGETIKMALSQTLRDAIANAGSTFAASTLDLGQGVIILAFGGMMAITDPDEISVGQLVTFQLYVNMMNGAYQSLNGVLNQFTKSAGAAERVLAMLESTTSIDPRAGAPIPDLLFQGTLRFENVSFRYQMRADRIALRGVNITFPQRKVTAIVGKSGGGKSTIMHLLLRMYDPTEGRITVDGVDMREVQLRWLHERMAVVAQDTQLFNATIADNIRYGAVRTQHDGGNARAHGTAATSLRSDAAFEGDGGTSFVTIVSEDGMKTTTTTAAARAISDEEVRQAAMRANAHDFIESFPEGYRTVVGERGVRLSGGQRQRIAIARALLRRPKILLLDEATSALDAESEAQVQSALDTLIQDLHRSDDANASCAVIVVAHRLSTVINADNIVVLQDGTVAEEGTHSELLERQGVYFQLVHKQLQEGRMTAVFDGAPAVDDATTAAAVPTSTASKPMAEGVVDGNDAVGGERRPNHRGGRGSGGRRRGGTARE